MALLRKQSLESDGNDPMTLELSCSPCLMKQMIAAAKALPF
ncbi:hypothetical protein [Streptomyces sp. NPDC093149]